MISARLQVAFDVAAQRSLIEANIPGHQMEAALNHLVKVVYYIKDYMPLFLIQSEIVVFS